MNPFLASARISVLHKKNISIYTIPVEENTNKIVSESSSIVDVEVDEFCKFYQFSRRLGLVRLLKPGGLRIFFYVLCKLERGKDFISLTRADVCKDLDISDTSVGLGINDLCENGILCKKSRSEYWINPIALFNGDRKKYFEENAPNKIYYIEDKNPTIHKYTSLKDETIIVK